MNCFAQNTCRRLPTNRTVSASVMTPYADHLANRFARPVQEPRNKTMNALSMGSKVIKYLRILLHAHNSWETQNNQYGLVGSMRSDKQFPRRCQLQRR